MKGPLKYLNRDLIWTDDDKELILSIALRECGPPKPKPYAGYRDKHGGEPIVKPVVVDVPGVRGPRGLKFG